MSRVNEIEYEGKKILFVDYNGIGPADIDAILAEARALISSAPENSVLLFSDFNDVRYDKDSTQKMKEFSRLVKVGYSGNCSNPDLLSG